MATAPLSYVCLLLSTTIMRRRFLSLPQLPGHRSNIPVQLPIFQVRSLPSPPQILSPVVFLFFVFLAVVSVEIKVAFITAAPYRALPLESDAAHISVNAIVAETESARQFLTTQK